MTDFAKSGLWMGKYLHELYQQAMTPWEWHPVIAQEASKHGLICFSSPFDETAVDFLEDALDPPLYKVASFELNHFPMLQRWKNLQTGISKRGVSQKHEIEHAVRVLKESICPEIVLLHCVSEYPANPRDFCLQNMPKLKEDYGVEFGLSDHSMGHVVAVAATALGARVIEKHLTLDRNESSIDGEFSMLPDEFQQMVYAVRMTHDSISGNQLPQTSAVFKRSILISSPVCEGDRLT